MSPPPFCAEASSEDQGAAAGLPWERSLISRGRHLAQPGTYSRAGPGKAGGGTLAPPPPTTPI